MKPEYLNDDELGPESPLSKIPKQNAFKVPENYFDSLPDEIMQQISALPDFEKVSTENPFKVPEGYFDSLPTVIQQKIAGRKTTSVFEEWVAAFRFKPKYAFVLVAVVILLVFGIKFLSTSNTGVQDNYLSCEEVKNSSYMTDMDESTLIDVLEQENGTSNKENVKEDNSLEQYLIDNNIDASQIENRL